MAEVPLELFIVMLVEVEPEVTEPPEVLFELELPPVEEPTETLFEVLLVLEVEELDSQWILTLLVFVESEPVF